MTTDTTRDDFSASEEPFGIYAARMVAKDMRRSRREHARRERNERSAFMVSARRKLEAQGWKF